MTSTGAPAAATASTAVEHVAGAGAAAQRGVDGVLDHRAVHERVGVGHADLDDVDAALDHRPHRRDRAVDVREADRQVADERGAALAARARVDGVTAARRVTSRRSR